MQKKTLRATLAFALILALLLAWAFAPRPVQVEVATATVGVFERTVDEDAKTRLRDRYVISAPLAGRLARINLKEGDRVDAGAVVATLSPALPGLLDDRTLREQRTRVETAEAQVQLAAARVAKALVARQQAEADAERSRQLAGRGFISPSKEETDRLSLEAAKREWVASSESRHVAEHELETARAALVAARGGPASSGAGFAVKAPVSGRVLKIAQASESPVALGAPLLEIGDISRLEIVAELLTTDALQTPPGSIVRIERWGGNGSLEGRVRQVDPAAFTKVSALGVEEQRVNVVIDLTSPPANWAALGDGYRVSVRIVTLARSDALRVPVSAVFPRPAEGQPDAMAVFRLEGDSARLVPVEVGARNGTEAWIKSGLSAGDRVIVYPPAAVRDGARVNVRRT